MLGFVDLVAFAGLTILMCAGQTAVQLSKSNGQIMYDTSMASLLVELVKLGISAYFLATQYRAELLAATTNAAGVLSGGGFSLLPTTDEIMADSSSHDDSRQELRAESEFPRGEDDDTSLSVTADDMAASPYTPNGQQRPSVHAEISTRLVPIGWKSLLKFAVPAVLYAINNNLAIHTAEYVSLSMYATLEQSKIVIVDFMRWVLLGVRPVPRRSGLLGLIALGAAVALAPPDCGGGHQNISADATPHGNSNPVVGFLLVAFMCVVSSFASVYSERLLKGMPGSFYWHNIQLYALGVLINSGISIFTGSTTLSFENFNSMTWVYIVE
jgi:hypothetical protein